MSEDRDRQVATTRARHGKDVYSRIARDRLMKMTAEERSLLAKRAANMRFHPEKFGKDGTIKPEFEEWWNERNKVNPK